MPGESGVGVNIWLKVIFISGLIFFLCLLLDRNNKKSPAAIFIPGTLSLIGIVVGVIGWICSL